MKPFLFLLCAVAALAQSLPPATDSSRILDIRRLMDTCPSNDPAYPQIRADFEMRRNGQPSPEFSCSEPVTDMVTSAVTNELVWSQILRVAYYMDRGRSNYLPWTNLRFYDWVKSKIGGLNFANLGNNVAGSCCITLGGRQFINITFEDDSNKRYHLTPGGAMGSIALLLGHEARHVDGFPHVSCCLNGSCDQTYDERNLSPYGIGAWMLRALILEDKVPTGMECEYAGAAAGIRNGLYQTYNGLSNVFCDAKPTAIPSPQPYNFVSCPTRTLTLGLGAVGNAANYAGASISNGEIVTVFSPSLGAGNVTGFQTGSDGKLRTLLEGTRFVVNGIPSPLLYVAPGQLGAIAPWDFGPGTQVNGQNSLLLEIVRDGFLSAPLAMNASTANPGIFTQDSSGSGPAAALNQDNTLNTAANPAAKGTVVQLFATGTGPFAIGPPQAYPPSPNDGRIMTGDIPALTYKVAVTVDGVSAEVVYGGQAPQTVAGFNQVNIRVPSSLTRSGALPLGISMTAANGSPVGFMLAGNPTLFVK